jgi:hypothetical protein
MTLGSCIQRIANFMKASHTGTVASAAAEKRPPKILLANRLPYECEKYPQIFVAIKSRREAK